MLVDFFFFFYKKSRAGLEVKVHIKRKLKVVDVNSFQNREEKEPLVSCLFKYEGDVEIM